MCFLGGFEKDTSTILRAIAGQLELEKGTIYMDGVDINTQKKNFLMQHVSYSSFDECSLFEKLTAKENISIFSNLAHSNSIVDIQTTSERYIDQNCMVEEMDIQEKSLLQFLVSLISDEKRILVLDEPSLYFDDMQREAMIDLVKKYKKDRFVLIKCSNDPALIDKLAQKFVIFPLDPEKKI